MLCSQAQFSPSQHVSGGVLCSVCADAVLWSGKAKFGHCSTIIKSRTMHLILLVPNQMCTFVQVKFYNKKTFQD